MMKSNERHGQQALHTERSRRSAARRRAAASAISAE